MVKRKARPSTAKAAKSSTSRKRSRNPKDSPENANPKRRRKRFGCHLPTCDQSFDKRSNRDQHERSHVCERNYQCKYCFDLFAQQANLTRHLQSHKCKVCVNDDAIYVDSAAFVKHYASAHPGKTYDPPVRNFQCTACDSKFKSFPPLGDHMKSCEMIVINRRLIEAEKKKEADAAALANPNSIPRGFLPRPPGSSRSGSGAGRDGRTRSSRRRRHATPPAAFESPPAAPIATPAPHASPPASQASSLAPQVSPIEDASCLPSTPAAPRSTAPVPAQTPAPWTQTPVSKRRKTLTSSHERVAAEVPRPCDVGRTSKPTITTPITPQQGSHIAESAQQLAFKAFVHNRIHMLTAFMQRARQNGSPSNQNVLSPPRVEPLTQPRSPPQSPSLPSTYIAALQDAQARGQIPPGLDLNSLFAAYALSQSRGGLATPSPRVSPLPSTTRSAIEILTSDPDPTSQRIFQQYVAQLTAMTVSSRVSAPLHMGQRAPSTMAAPALTALDYTFIYNKIKSIEQARHSVGPPLVTPLANFLRAISPQLPTSSPPASPLGNFRAATAPTGVPTSSTSVPCQRALPTHGATDAPHAAGRPAQRIFDFNTDHLPSTHTRPVARPRGASPRLVPPTKALLYSPRQPAQSPASVTSTTSAPAGCAWFLPTSPPQSPMPTFNSATGPMHSVGNSFAPKTTPLPQSTSRIIFPDPSLQSHSRKQCNSDTTSASATSVAFPSPEAHGSYRAPSPLQNVRPPFSSPPSAPAVQGAHQAPSNSAPVSSFAYPASTLAAGSNSAFDSCMLPPMDASAPDAEATTLTPRIDALRLPPLAPEPLPAIPVDACPALFTCGASSSSSSAARQSNSVSTLERSPPGVADLQHPPTAPQITTSSLHRKSNFSSATFGTSCSTSQRSNSTSSEASRSNVELRFASSHSRCAGSSETFSTSTSTIAPGNGEDASIENASPGTFDLKCLAQFAAPFGASSPRFGASALAPMTPPFGFAGTSSGQTGGYAESSCTSTCDTQPQSAGACSSGPLADLSVGSASFGSAPDDVTSSLGGEFEFKLNNQP